MGYWSFPLNEYLASIDYYASPSFENAYSDQQLTPNFELWVEINFLCADMFPYENSEIVSVCPYPEERNHHSFVNISPTVAIDTSLERSSRILQHGNPKFDLKKNLN